MPSLVYTVPRMAKDPYKILGVERSASEQEIKQAYRKLSKELHPDKHKGDKSKEDSFKEVNQAYEILSDPKKKQMYDQFGNADAGAGFGGGGGFGGFDFSGFQGGAGGFDPSQFEGLGDLFETFFGSSGGRRPRRNDGNGRDIEIEMTIPFEAAVTGMEREVTFTTQVQCADCNGGGGEKGSGMVTCKECDGKGSVVRQTRSLFGTIQQNAICPTCHGSGKVPEKPCKQCNGEGRRQDRKSVKVRVPAGIDDGQSLKITGEGEAGRNGAPAGALFVRMRVQPDERFVRDGDDIRTMLDLSVIDAALGTTVDVDTVQGTSSMTIPAGTQPGQVLRVKGKGMPVLNTSRHGDHYVTISVAVPSKLSKEEKKLFEELKKLQK